MDGVETWRALTAKAPEPPKPVEARGAEPAAERAVAARGEAAPLRQEEAALIERIRRGDRQAFRVLVDRYQRRVYTLALGFVRDPDEARDVSQEAFLKVYRHLDTFHGQSNFYTWLYRITVNLCIDLRRKAGRGNQSEFDERIAHEEAGSPADQISPGRLRFDPAKALHNRELRERLNTALEQLSETHRSVLLLREVEGLSYKEIAEVLECPEGTVMSRLFHARRQMQQLLLDFAEPGPTKEAANLA
jgi:RNA polymerase sigma-70 factor (ECF subfamily)